MFLFGFSDELMKLADPSQYGGAPKGPRKHLSPGSLNFQQFDRNFRAESAAAIARRAPAKPGPGPKPAKRWIGDPPPGGPPKKVPKVKKRGGRGKKPVPYERGKPKLISGKPVGKPRNEMGEGLPNRYIVKSHDAKNLPAAGEGTRLVRPKTKPLYRSGSPFKRVGRMYRQLSKPSAYQATLNAARKLREQARKMPRVKRDPEIQKSAPTTGGKWGEWDTE